MMIGIGTVVGAKGDREQHWSIPPTMVSDADEHGEAASGGDREPDNPGSPGSLPACA